MKKTIIILSLLLATVSSIAQSKDTTARFVPKPIPPPFLPDTTDFISVKKINDWLPSIQDKVSFKTYNDFMTLLGDLVATARKDWMEQEAKKKK